MAYIETMLSQWESYGLFDYLLPFLLIFALVYGILSHTKSFGENNAVHLTIALVLGILALRMGFVQDFFREIFPRFGIALAVLLVVVILMAAFIPGDHKTGWSIGIYVLGGIAALLVVFNSFSALGFFGSGWWYEWGAMIVGALFIIGLIIAMSVTRKNKGGGGAPHS